MKPLKPSFIRDGVGIVTLTSGYEAIVDAEDLPRVAQWHWHASLSHQVVYARGHVRLDGVLRLRQMHRFLLDAPDGMAVDHINGNGLDNRRCNLRLATPQQNAKNGRRRGDNQAGFKGVSRATNGQRWVAQIRKDGRTRYLGSFETPEEASACYQAAALEVHGEFANLGFEQALPISQKD